MVLKSSPEGKSFNLSTMVSPVLIFCLSANIQIKNMCKAIHANGRKKGALNNYKQKMPHLSDPSNTQVAIYKAMKTLPRIYDFNILFYHCSINSYCTTV